LAIATSVLVRPGNSARIILRATRWRHLGPLLASPMEATDGEVVVSEMMG